MKTARVLSFCCACIFIALSPSLGFGQSVPVPEYYGIYVVADGQLVKLDSKAVQATKYVTVPFGQRNAVGNIVNGQPAALPAAGVRIPVFPADFQIVIYQQSSGIQSPQDVAQSIHLVPLVFVRTLNVDTGFPNNIHRSAMENGWDDGNPAEMVMANQGGQQQDLELLVKPMPGHQDMVIAGLQQKLAPGVYRISQGEQDPMAAMMGGGKGLAFAVEPLEQGETQKCVNESLSYMMTMSKTAYSPCSGSLPEGMATASSTDVANPAAGCSNYGSCFKSGLNAWTSGSWEEAIADFRQATIKDATKGDAWTWLGRAELAAGHTNEFPAAWDKAISLGFPLILGVCHEKGFMAGNCERGNLTISTTHISFGRERETPLFSAPAQQVTPKGSMHLPLVNQQGFSPAYFRVAVDKKNYNFDFIPFGVTCQTELPQAMCPADGTAQQMAVGSYVMQVIPRIASGEIGSQITPH